MRSVRIGAARGVRAPVAVSGRTGPTFATCPWMLGVVGIAGTCLVAACGSTRATVRRVPGPTLVAGGCGATNLYHGRVPAWTAPAFSDSSPGPPPWPHALSRRGTVVAIVFGDPLRADDPTNTANKVLWIMRLPRQQSGGARFAPQQHACTRHVRSTQWASRRPVPLPAGEPDRDRLA